MKLLFVLGIGFDREGPSVHLLQDILIAALDKGHSVVVVLKKTGGPYEEMPSKLKTNKRFQFFVIDEQHKKQQKGFLGRYLSEIRYSKECSRFVSKSDNFDAVFLQSTPAVYFYMKWLIKLNCRIVFNVQDIFPYNLKLSGQLPFETISFPFLRKLQNLGYRKADKIITISDDMKQTLVSDGVKASNIEVVYNWSYSDTSIRLERIDKANVYDFCLDKSKFNIVYAGNIGKMQNVELIARVAKEMNSDSSFHFYIIGDGANKETVKAIVKGLSNVTILPMQPTRYAESIYAQADLNVIPLMPGGIKTAIPSKTATAIRAEKPILFCCDTDSLFYQLIRDDDQIYAVDCMKASAFVETIRKLQSEKGKEYHSSALLKLMSKNNAYKYISIMTNE